MIFVISRESVIRMVDMKFDNLDLSSLKRIYETANLKFQEALIQGAEWREMQDQREFLVELAVAIQRKEPSYFMHPAASERTRDETAAP